MNQSNLKAIINRLEAMTQDETDSIQIRYFSANDQERAKVIFDREKDLFTLTDMADGETLAFDNIDFLAVEILELIQPKINGDHV